MAVTVGQLAAALRITDGAQPTEPQLSILTRLMGVAQAMVELTAPDAPEVIRDQAAIQLAAYLYDQPTAGGGNQYAAAFKNSGALSLLAKWISRRAAEPSDGTGAVTGGVDLSQIALWALANNPDPIPVEKLINAIGEAGGLNSTQVNALIAAAFDDFARIGRAFGGTHDPVANTIRYNVSFLPTSTDFFLLAIPANLTDSPDPLTVEMRIAGQPEVVSGLLQNFDMSPVSTDELVANSFLLAAYADAMTHPVNITRFLLLEPTDLTVGQITNPTSDHYGLVSGRRLRQAIAAGTSDWALEGDTTLIPADKYRLPTSTSRGAPVAVTNTIVDDDTHTAGTLYAWSRGHVKRLIDRVAVTSGNLTAQIVAQIATWAIKGNTSQIPVAKLPFALPNWLSSPLTHDIPYSLLNTLLEPWAVILGQDARDNGEVPTHVPDERLPIVRFLPSPTGLADGKIAVISSGAWAVGDQEGGTGTASKNWRFQFVRGEDTADPITAAGKVFLELRYFDTYNSEGVRTAVQDLGAAYVTAGGNRTIATVDALDVKALLAQASVEARAVLIDSLPNVTSAEWGTIYGLSNDGLTVESMNYRREGEIHTLRWGISLLGGSGIAVVRGFQRQSQGSVPAGGSISPDIATIVNLTENQSIAHGTHYVELDVLAANTALTSGTSITMLYGDGFTESIVLIRDHAYTNTSERRYTSANYVGAKFITGERPEVRFRNGGSADLAVIGASNLWEQFADQEAIEVARFDVLTELYRAEARIAALEAAPAPTGGGGLSPGDVVQGLAANLDNLYVETVPPVAIPSDIFLVSVERYSPEPDLRSAPTVFLRAQLSSGGGDGFQASGTIPFPVQPNAGTGGYLIQEFDGVQIVLAGNSAGNLMLGASGPVSASLRVRSL